MGAQASALSTESMATSVVMLFSFLEQHYIRDDARVARKAHGTQEVC